MSLSPLKSCFCILLLWGPGWLLQADTIYLANGDKLEVTITRDTGTAIEVNVRVSNGITDQRTIQKTDILRIEKPSPVDSAYDEIKNLQPPPNSMPVVNYDRIIIERLQPFLARYPLSEHAGVVQKTLALFTSEKERVKAGDIKVGGQWFTPEEAVKSSYQINASLLFQQIQSSAARGDFRGALNLYTTLEKNYKGARIIPDAVTFVRGLIGPLRQEINNKTIILKHDLEDRASGMTLTPDYRKEELIAAAKKEEEQTNAALDDYKKAGVIWTPIYPRSQRSLDDLKATADSESTRLAGLKVDDMRASIAASDQGRDLLQQGDLSGATTSFADAAKLWPDNQQLKENDALLIAAKAAPSPTPVASATPTPKPTPHRPPPTPAAVVATAPAPAPAPEPDKPFLLTLPGMLSILIVLGVLGGGAAYFTQSRKKKTIEI